MAPQNISFKPIGHVNSPYKQKFVVPRQANLVSAGFGSIELNQEYSDINSLRGMEQFSHLWIIFFLHATAEKGWSPTVQPPRLGGKKRVGVFSSRAPYRPNPIGISAVEYIEHYESHGRVLIKVGGLDLLDGTPVLDLKPYIPYADSIPNASGGYAAEKPPNKLVIVFSRKAEEELIANKVNYPNLKELIVQLLTLDPRPAWRVKNQDNKQYGVTLYDLNIKFRIEGKQTTVISIRAE